MDKRPNGQKTQWTKDLMDKRPIFLCQCFTSDKARLGTG